MFWVSFMDFLKVYNLRSCGCDEVNSSSSSGTWSSHFNILRLNLSSEFSQPIGIEWVTGRCVTLRRSPLHRRGDLENEPNLKDKCDKEVFVWNILLLTGVKKRPCIVYNPSIIKQMHYYT